MATSLPDWIVEAARKASTYAPAPYKHTCYGCGHPLDEGEHGKECEDTARNRMVAKDDAQRRAYEPGGMHGRGGDRYGCGAEE